MKKGMISLLLFISHMTFAQVIDVNWSDSFQKELSITCEAGDLLCQNVCQASSFCSVPEGYCRDCIGTSVKMNYLISEIGNRIQNSGEETKLVKVEKILKQKDFVTFTAQEVYNIIDASQSTRTYRKFEKLCPEGSVNQILFLRVDTYTREIQKPEFVYCDLFERTVFYEITTEVVVEREFNGPLNLY